MPRKFQSANSDDKMLWRIEKSLRAGEVVQMGSISLRKALRNEVWEDESTPPLAVKALENGLYIQLPTTRHDESAPVQTGKKWLHAGPFDNLELVVEPYLAEMSIREKALLMQTLTFRAAMKAIDTESSRLGIKTQSALSVGI